MNLALFRANQRKTAQRALKAFQSDHVRDKQASEEAFEWCLIGMIALIACSFALGMILSATGVL